MTAAPDNLTPADPRDLAAAIAFALRFDGRRRVRKSDERLVEHLLRSGFLVMKRPPIGGGAALGQGVTPSQEQCGFGRVDSSHDQTR